MVRGSADAKRLMGAAGVGVDQAIPPAFGELVAPRPTGPLEELAADQIVIDEIRGRRAAGAEQGLVDLRSAVDRLRETSLYIAADILDRLTGGK